MAASNRKVDWSVLVETVHFLPLYASHKAYTRDKIIMQKPDITAEELVRMLGIPLGEALVLLWELRKTGEEVIEMLQHGVTGQHSYTLSALGGTFSTLHVGHAALLFTAFNVSEKVVVGITSDRFAATLAKKHAIQPFEERERNIRNFLSERGWLDRARIVRLDDPYGPTVEDPTIEALVVSPSTSHRAVEINAKRVERNMKPLEVVVCPLVVAEDGLPVSTTRIMNGEITPEGKVVRKA
jgi:pantetheine-phosphate adenylyltransferase